MARIAGINIPPHKHTSIGLTAIFGVGRTRARQICEAAGVPLDKKVKELNDAELERIREQIGAITVEGDLRREVQLSIKRLIDLGTYRGLRHKRGLPAAPRSAYPHERPYPQGPASRRCRAEEIIRIPHHGKSSR